MIAEIVSLGRSKWVGDLSLSLYYLQADVALKSQQLRSNCCGFRLLLQPKVKKAGQWSISADRGRSRCQGNVKAAFDGKFTSGQT